MPFNPDQYISEKAGSVTGFDPNQYIAEKTAASPSGDVGFLEPAANAFNYVSGKAGELGQKYSGAPYRAALNSLAENPGEYGKALKTGFSQIGAPPENVPSGTDIAKKFGINDTRLSSLIPAIYRQNEGEVGLKKEGLLDPSLASLYGGVVNVTDPASLALAAAQPELEGLGKSAREAAEKATEFHLRPTAAESNALGPAGKKAAVSETLDSGTLAPFQKADTTAAKLGLLKQNLGEQLGDLVENSGKTVDPVEVAEILQKKVIDPLSKVSANNDIVAALTKQKNDFLEMHAPQGVPTDERFNSTNPIDFTKERDRSPHSQFLSGSSAQDLQNHQLYLNNNRVGYALSPNGDLQNVFNNSGVRGAGENAVIEGIQRGAKTLDAFDDHLPDYYNNFGFNVTKRVKWDDAYAPPGWNYEKYGRPDIVYMEYPESLSRDPGTVRARYEAARIEKSERVANAPHPASSIGVSPSNELIDWKARGELGNPPQGLIAGSNEVPGQPIRIPLSTLEAEKTANQKNINYRSSSSSGALQASKDYAKTLRQIGEDVMNDPEFTRLKEAYGNIKAAKGMAQRTGNLVNSGAGLLGHITDAAIWVPVIEAAMRGDFRGVPLVIARELTKNRLSSAAAVGANAASKGLLNVARNPNLPLAQGAGLLNQKVQQ